MMILFFWKKRDHSTYWAQFLYSPEMAILLNNATKVFLDTDWEEMPLFSEAGSKAEKRGGKVQQFVQLDFVLCYASFLWCFSLCAFDLRAIGASVIIVLSPSKVLPTNCFLHRDSSFRTCNWRFPILSTDSFC